MIEEIVSLIKVGAKVTTALLLVVGLSFMIAGILQQKGEFYVIGIASLLVGGLFATVIWGPGSNEY